MISDWLYPKTEVIPNNNEKITKDYLQINPLWFNSKSEDYIQKMLSSLIKRLSVIKNLFLKKKWNLFFVVFSEFDFLLHKLYNQILSGKGIGQKTDEIFSMIDEFIGWIKDHCPHDSLLLVVSDHGFTTYKHVTHVNMLLENVGLAESLSFLQSFKRRSIPSKLIRNHLSTFKSSKFLRKILFSFYGHGTLMRRYTLDYDLKGSIALMHGHTHSGIYINSKDIFQNGLLNPLDTEKTINKIKTYLLNVKYHSYGKVFQKIYTREELFYGPFVHHFPHLIFFPNKDFWFDSAVGKTMIEEKEYAGHCVGGMFLSWGENVTKGKQLNPISIYDITPTILHHLQQPIPHDTDGRVIFEMFTKDSSTKSEMLKQKNYLSKWNLQRRIKSVSQKNVK
jgi:predicted AlkP superfamily phosphohydrolase/phosphomutase